MFKNIYKIIHMITADIRRQVEIMNIEYNTIVYVLLTLYKNSFEFIIQLFHSKGHNNI